MQAGDWTPDEWAALTADEADPEVKYEPWGPKMLTPEQLADADYVARKLLGIGAVHAGPPGWLLNYAVPDKPPASAGMRKVDAGLDYVGRFLGPLLALLGSEQLVLGKGGKVLSRADKPSTTRVNDTLDQLEEWQQLKPWKKTGDAPFRTWDVQRPPEIGSGPGPTKLRSFEEYNDLVRQRHGYPEPARQAVDVSDDVLELALDQWMSLPDNAAAARRPGGRR